MLPVEYETYSYTRADSVTVTSIIVYVCIMIARDSVVCHMIVMSTNQIVTMSCSFCWLCKIIWTVVYVSLFCAVILNQVIIINRK